MPEVLENRENRVRRQRKLLEECRETLVCLTMNIPGPIKNNDLIAWGYRLGRRQLLALFQSCGIPVLRREEISEVTGNEGFFVVDAPAETVKSLTVRLEESSSFGRLLDIDVLTPKGEKLSRGSGRKCLICGKPASSCGPIRAHSAAELWQRTEEILKEAVAEDRSRRIGALAAKALLYEVCITPKPGLVDRVNRGAHRDMDIFTFMGSSAALQPYFTDCAMIGMEGHFPAETFAKLRLRGMLAEGEMLRETGSVNTHKGAIFTMGLACAAAGGLKTFDADELLVRCAAMTCGLTAKDFRHVTPASARTAGEKLYAEYGITGIRGQAEEGFPAVKQYGLPVLEKGLSEGLSVDRAGAAALLAILAHTDDTNLITRSDRETQQSIAAEVAALLEKAPYPDGETLAELDRQFIERNLSPGGSADLLALTLFLYFLSQTNEEEFL